MPAAAAGLVLLGLCGLLVGGEYFYRQQEVKAAAWAIVHILGMRTLLLDGERAPVLYAGNAAGFDRGIALTLGCSTALLVAAFALLTGMLLLFSSRSPARVLAAFAITAALLPAANFGRLALIVVMQHRYGAEGFGWAHALLGSTLMMAAGLGAFWLYAKVIAREPDRDGREPTP